MRCVASARSRDGYVSIPRRVWGTKRCRHYGSSYSFIVQAIIQSFILGGVSSEAGVGWASAHADPRTWAGLFVILCSQLWAFQSQTLFGADFAIAWVMREVM